MADSDVAKLSRELGINIAVDLGPINGGEATVGAISSSNGSAYGANSESIETIRYRAPRWFAAQERGVSNDDYKSLVLSQFGSNIQDINVFGGQEIEPKQYGRVVITLKPAGSTIAPDYVKNQVSNYLSSYISLPTRVVIADPDCDASKAIADLAQKLAKRSQSIVGRRLPVS